MHELSSIYHVHPEPVHVRYAREQARKILAGWGLLQHADLAALIVSELVTNALKQSRHSIEIRLSYDRRDVSIEVTDRGSGTPARQAPAADAEQGRGLQLVDGLIAEYSGERGIIWRVGRPGKTVYATFSPSLSRSSISDESPGRSIGPPDVGRIPRKLDGASIRRCSRVRGLQPRRRLEDHARQQHPA
jgi:anti-sigma regulatory factor (Ser/Thr protein kinase)